MPDSLSDPERLSALSRIRDMGAWPRESLDRLARIAARLLHVPVALVSLVDDREQCFAGQVGLEEPVALERRTPLSHSFCKHVVLTEEPLVIEDARRHPLVMHNPAIRDLKVVAYCGVPIRASNGKVLGSLCAIDHEPRKWTQEDVDTLSDLASAVMAELRLQELLLNAERERSEREALLQAVGDGIYVIDTGGVCTFVNQAATAMLGYEEGELLGKYMHGIVHHRRPDGTEYPEEECPVYRTLLTGQPFRNVEEFLWRKDGTGFPAEYSSSPIIIGGKIMGAVVTFRNITQRHALERVRREFLQEIDDERRRLETILESLPVGVLIAEAPTGRIVQGNGQVEAILGHPVLETLEVADYSKWHGYHEDGTPLGAEEWPLARAVLHGETVTGQELLYRRPDGGDIWLSVSAAPVRNSDGQLIGAVATFQDVTARRRSEEERARLLEREQAARAEAERIAQALWRSEERLRLALEAGRMGTWDYEPATDRMSLSSTMEEMHGLPVGGFRGGFEDFLRLVYPADRLRLRDALDSAARHGGSFHSEYRLAAVEDGFRWIEIRGRVFYDPSGTPVRLSGVSVDVTDRRRAEDSLRFLAEAERVLGSSLDYDSTLQSIAQLPVPFLADWCALDLQDADSHSRRVVSARWDPASSQVVVEEWEGGESPVWQAVVGKSQPLLLPEVTQELLDRYLPNAEQQEMVASLGARSVMGVPLATRGRVNGVLWFLITTSERIYTEDDLALALDLAQRAALAVENARLYDDLQEQAGQLQQLAEAALVINAATSLDAILRAVSETARNILGAHLGLAYLAADWELKKALASLSCSERYSQWAGWTPSPALLGSLVDVLGESRTARLTLAEMQADERCLRLLEGEHGAPPLRGLLLAALTDREGNRMGMVVLSDKRQGEFTLRDQAMLLQIAQLASVATDNFQLLRQTQEAVQMRSEFLAMVSHDLKNPLVSVKGMAQLLRRQLERGDCLDVQRLIEGLDKIDSVATRMSAQINELLDTARLQMGEPLELDVRPFDLVSLARQLVEQHARTTSKHNVELRTDLGELVGEWDQLRIERVLSNLLSNAIKYSPEGGDVVVTVRTEEADGRSWAVVDVTDQGLGIPARELPRIFDRFYRASNVEGRIGGTGVGLASVRMIVEQHGGRISVTSQEGRGSTFSVWLPLPGAA